MKKLLGLCFIIACGLDVFAADSNKFTLNTKREDFVITGFDSRICDGPYNGGGRKAYLLPNYVGVGAGIKFKVKTESKDIVGYIYSDNPDTVVHSDTHSFSIYNLSPGQKLTVRGVDKDGFKTPEFRANFDVIPVPPWAMVALDVTANRVMENGKTLRYSVGEASWTWESNVKNWSGRKYIPTFNKKAKAGLGVSPKLGAAFEYTSDGIAKGSVGYGYTGTGDLSIGKGKSGKYKYNFLGNEIEAGLKGSLSFSWDEPKNSFGLYEGQVTGFLDANSMKIPFAYLGPVEFAVQIGGSAEIGGKYTFKGAEWGHLCDNFGWVVDAKVPRIKLTGGIGKGKVHAEAYVEGSSEWAYDGGCKYVALNVAGGAEIQAFCFKKGIELFEGTWQVYPWNGMNAPKSVFSLTSATAADFSRVTSKPRSSCVPLQVVIPKDGGVGGRMLMIDAPVESPSQVLWQNESLCIVVVQDDAAGRTGLNVCKASLLTESEDGALTSQVIWDDGTSDYFPQLASLGGNKKVASWMNVGRLLTDEDDLASSLLSMEIAVAVYDGTGTWASKNLTRNSLVDSMPSLAAATNNKAIVVWQRNAVGELYATSDSPDSLVSSRYENGAWTDETVIAANVGQVTSGSLAFDGTRAVYVYERDMDYSDETMEDREIFAVQFEDGAWSAPVRLTNDEASDVNPKVAFDSQGRIVCVWYRDDKMVARYLPEEDYQIVCQLPSDTSTQPFTFLYDNQGGLKGLTVGMSLTNQTFSSVEMCASLYDVNSRTWGGFVALTHNTEEERDTRAVMDNEGNVHFVYLVRPELTSSSDFGRYGTLKEIVYSPGVDLAIGEGGLSFDDDVIIGSNTTIRVKIENRGWAPLPTNTNILARLYRNDALIAENIVTNDIPVGGEAEITFNWIASMTSSNAMFTAVVDEDNAIVDVNRSNNCYSNSYFETDLTIDSIVVRNVPGGYVDMSAIVKNNGFAFSSEGTTVEFRLNSEDGELIGTDTIGRVGRADGMEYVASVEIQKNSLNITSAYTKVFAIVNANKTIIESNYANNIAIGTLYFPDDSDGDGLNDDYEGAIGSNPNNVDSDGDGISDFDEVRTYGSSPTNFSYRITFDAGSNGLMRDGTASALVVADTGVSPRPATVTPKSGYRFVGWEETLTPATGEMTYHAKYEEIAYYVNAVTGCDTNSGETASSSWKTLQYAVNNMPDDRRVYVADGVYEPFTCTNRNIVIESVNGPRYTIIDGGGTNRCATLGTSAGHTNTVLRGFTLRNGNANGNAVVVSRKYGGGVCFGTLEDCHIYGNTAYTYQYSDSFGGGAYAANLRNCIIGGNWGYYGGGVHLPRLASGAFVVEECVCTRNRGSTGSAIFVGNGTGESPSVCKCLIDGNWATSWGAAYDAKRDNSFLLNKCTVIGNSSLPYNSAGVGYASAIDSIIWDNRTRVDVVDNHTSAIMTNCCTTPLPSGAGNISDNPQFVDAEHRVYQLMPDSPCIGAASNGSDMGASVVAPTSGFVIGTDTDGYGLILEPGTVVEDGGNVAFTAAEIGREFLHFKTNGVFATSDRVLELSNIHSDILVTAVFARREFFVDAANGNDGNDGLSWATARRSITSAINDTMDYDIITVMNGVYSPITPGTKKIKIQSVNGAAETVIDGGAERICVSCNDNGPGITNTLVVGFTLRNGYAPYAGGGAHGAILRDCVISHNQSDNSAGGTSWSRLENCVVTCNKGSSSGGSYAGSAERSTFCGNVATMNRAYGGVSGTVLSDCIVYGNEPRLGDDNENPLLVDAWNGDARLRVGSPCIVNGIQVRGAYVGAPVEGVSVSVGVQGTGTVSNETILVLSGSDAPIEAVETERPFLYWIINGEQVEDRIYTLTNVTTDVRAIAVFGTYDWYVDAEYGDDANDGSDWDTAKRTLQAAVAAAVDDEVIYVEAGTYGPISTDNKRIRIESVNGAEMTFIDGGGTSRCATLGTISTHTNSALVGFTLMNGRAPQSGSYSYGGGSYYGTLEYCIISNCVANGYYAYGGGAYYGNLNNCLVAYNCATSSSYRAYGGGTYGSYLRSTTIARNRAIGVNAAYYGGAYGDWNSAYNSIIWDNEVRSSNASSTYYPNTYATYLYYCCTDGTVSYRQSGCVTNDPQFVDADVGDFHLMVGSPCVNTGYDWYVQGDMDLDWDDRIQGTRVDMGCYEGAEYAAPPGQVTGLRAVRGVLTWDAMSDADGFMVYRSTRRAASSAKYIGMSDTNTYTDETAADGTTYYYWVQAFNTLGMGMRSDGVENTWPLLLTITTSELPDATEMVEYSAQLEATGGVAPYSWSSKGGYVPTRADNTYSEVGTAQGWNADDNCWSLALPFDFPFYGNKYRTAYINSNGTITFDGYFDRWSYSIQNFTNRVMIAALWSDLDTSYGGDIYVSANSDAVTIRWVCQYHGGGGSIAASATLYANGAIRLAYGSGNANGGFVGVSAGDGVRNTSLGSGLTLNATQDIVLRNGGIADGLFITEEGQITGAPTAAGINTFIVTVTDAAGDTAEKELSIAVAENPNHKPEIDAVSPTTNIYVKVGDSATFAVTAHDPEGAALEYAWYLDGEEIECIANSYTFTATLDDAGAHTLECVVSDGLWTDMVRHTWSFRVVRDWYVDASTEDDSGDGSSADSAISRISEALRYAEDGDTIYVAPGAYDDYLEFYSGLTVSIVATGGASSTFFTGQFEGYSTEWHSDAAMTQSSLTGFTLKGSYVRGVTLHDCVLTCDETGCYPSEAYGCRLFDSAVTGNTCDYSLIEQCELTRCTVAGNTVGEYGAVGYSSYVYDSIVWDNVTVDGEAANYDTETWYDEWWDDDAEEYVSEEYAEVHIFNSCTWPMPSGIAGTGNITIDPRLVDAVNGDLRLRVGSPCLVGGVQTMGVYLGDPVAGFVLSVRIEGSGAVSPMTAVVSNGGNATFEVADNTRPFLGFLTNGVFATAADTLTWQGVKTDGIVTAVFSNFTFYVDAATGDDANDGLSWATARASIQSAIDDAARGETIYVKAGTYDPIVVGAAMRLRIESVDGKETTVIDGGGERQCANLGGNDSFSSTLVGFTLINGYSSYGGGAHGGTLVDCDVMGNYARYQGGGLYYSTAIRCEIIGNKVGDTNMWSNATGGGAYNGTLRNCLVVGNTAESSNYCEGGGTGYSTLYNCTVVSNAAYGNGYGGGVCRGNIYNTIVFGNYADYDDETQYVWTMQKSLVGADPGFIDAENGDYRLAVGSPCIDAGSNSYVLDDNDLDGNERIQHYTVDIGCYEYELATPGHDAEADFAAQMAGTCYGVFVGVGQYTYTSSLTGPTIDATNMQARCIAKGYWRDENTVAFLDAAATKAVVRAKLATLAAKAVSGDTVLYYQSSHGGNNYDQYGNMTKDTCICLHDETYEDYEMAEDLMRFAAGVKVVIVLDTCHSAGMFKSMGKASSASAKSFAVRVRELMTERSALRKGVKSGITTDDIGWIAAADYNQYSYDSPRGGAFTVALLDGWKTGAADYDGDKRLNFHELWRYAKGIAVGYGGSDASDAQCLNEDVLLSRFAGTPDSSGNGNTTETTPVPVEHVWLNSYPEVLAAFGGDYEAMGNAQSPGASGRGKIWSDGSPCYVWQDFVAGTSPTNDTVFTATIRMEGNTPVISWEPDVSELRATRRYRTLGKKTLLDANWTDITDKDKSEYHFFKVTVNLP